MTVTAGVNTIVEGGLIMGLAARGRRHLVLRTSEQSSVSMLKYIELKSDQDDCGPAWIARVKLSKSGRTVYFGRKALKRIAGGGISGNHFDVETGEEYWVSGVKKNGLDRHWAGSGVVWIEESAVAEYLRHIGVSELDHTRLEIVPDLPEPVPGRFIARENAKLEG